MNVVAVGPPGVGKSHLLAAVAHDLVLQGYAVLWTPTAQLMQRRLSAKRDLRLPQELAKLHRYACLVLLRRRTGIPVSPHLFRHTRATTWLRDDQLSLESTSALLGHASIETTRSIYDHRSMEDVKKEL